MMGEIKPIKCEHHKNTWIASNNSLIPILDSLLKSKLFEVMKIQKCDAGGWYIYVKKEVR
jgi:hypothetical protein